MFVAVGAAVAIGVAIVIVSGERDSEEVCALARCLVINWQIIHTEFTCRSETKGASASQEVKCMSTTVGPDVSDT